MKWIGNLKAFFGEVMAESLRVLAVPPDALPEASAGVQMQAMSQ